MRMQAKSLIPGMDSRTSFENLGHTLGNVPYTYVAYTTKFRFSLSKIFSRLDQD